MQHPRRRHETPAPTPPAPRLTTISKAARILGMSRTTIYRLIERGALPTVDIGGLRRIPIAAIDELTEDRR